ncbi:MAG: HprK-related kinase A [Azonexaceae bacterium]|nr:HprK-related kinase A [Azonexaceae bacterium]
MRVSELAPAELVSRLERGDLLISIPPFIARIQSSVKSLAKNLALMYGEFQLIDPAEFADFHVRLAAPSGLRRWIKPQVLFYFDGIPAFKPLPLGQALPMLEWGLNWCVAAHCHQYLVIHAAVVEKNGKAVVLPAPPGSGKSTLCAGLVCRGWRLLSDELALYDMDSNLIYGMARPVNLKNASIDVIKSFAPEVVMSEPVADTTKGTVALMRPPSASVQQAQNSALPAWIVLPKYLPDAPVSLESNSSAHTFLLLAEQSFNYDILGVRGFRAVGKLIDQCDCYRITYSDLEAAVLTLDRLVAECVYG